MGILGAAFKELPDDLKKQLNLGYGRQVTGVSSGKMSDAGVRKGFIILKANDQPMRNVRVTAVHIGSANAADSGNSPAAAAERWAVCGEQAAPCRRQVPCRNPPSTFPQPYREKVEKVCRQNRSHRHPPDRRNSGNGCPPSCWGVCPRERDSTSCRSGLRRSRIALLPAGSRWRSLRPKRQRCYPPSQWAGYRRKDEAR